VVVTLIVMLSAEIDEESAKVRTSWSVVPEVAEALTVTPFVTAVVVVVVVGGTVVVVVVGGTVVVVVGGTVVVVVVDATEPPALPHGFAESYGTGVAPLGTATITAPLTMVIA
jgi:hypothetical protein